MADRYWVGGTGTWNTTSTTNWSASSGGASGASVPTVADNVFFDQAGTYTVTMTGALACLDITVSAGTVTFAQGTSPTLNVRGSMTLLAGTVWSATGTITFSSTSTGRTVTTNGVTISGSINFNGVGGGWTLGSALTLSNSLQISGGTLDTSALGNYAITGTQLFTSGSTVRALNLNASVVTLSLGSATAISASTITNFTFNAGTSQINLTGPTAGITCAGLTFYNVAFTSTVLAFASITGINTFNNFSVVGPASIGQSRILFDTQQTINGILSTTGTAGNRRVIFTSNVYGLSYDLVVNATPSLTDADFSGLYVRGTAAPISGTRIGNRGECRGITFSTPKTVYQVATGSSFSGNNWSAISGGGVSTDNFPLPQDTAVLDNASNSTVTIDPNLPALPTIDASARTAALTFNMDTATVYGSWTNGPGVTLSGVNTITFSGGTTQTITSAGKTFPNALIIDTYGGVVQLADALNIGSNNLQVTNGTFNTQGYAVTAASLASTNSNVRTITLGASTLTLSGVSALQLTTTTNLTFNAGTSNINCNLNVNGSSTLELGGLTFYNLTWSNNGIIFSLTINGANTFNNLTLGAPAGDSIFNYQFASNQVINGTLTCSGTSAVRRVCLRSNSIGAQRTITAAAISATDCDFRDINLAGAASGASPTRAGDCGGNTGITFPAPKTVYWNLAGAQNWSATAWAPGSGGTPNINQFPLAQDTAVFDNAGFVGTVTINSEWNFGTFDASLRTTAMTLSVNPSNSLVNIYGDWKFGTGVISSISTSNIIFSKNGTQTITSNGVQCNFPITVGHQLSTVQLADALLSSESLTVFRGTFDAVTYNVTVSSFLNTTAAANTIRMGSGTWTLSGTGTVWSFSQPPATFIVGTSTIVLSNTSTSTRTFTGGAFYYNKITIGGTTGTSVTTFGPSTFGEIASTKTVAHTVSFAAISTTTIGKWSITGTLGNVVTISSSSPGTSYILSIAGPATSGIDYLSVRDCALSGNSPGEFYVGANSVNVANNSGVVFTATPAPRTLFWVGGTGNWTDTARWSTSSGGPSGAAIPTSLDSVTFNAASNATAYTATLNAAATIFRCAALTVAGPASGNLTFAGSQPIAIHGNITFAATGITYTYSSTFFLCGNSSYTLTTNGINLQSAINISGINSTWTLGSSFSSLLGVDVTYGTFSTSASNYAVACSTFSSSNNNVRTISLNGSSLSINILTFTTSTNLTFNAGTSTINYNNISTFSGGGMTFNNVDWGFAGGTVTITGQNTFNRLLFPGSTSLGIYNITFSANQTITTLTLGASTGPAYRAFIASNAIGTQRTLSVGTLTAGAADYDFRDIAITGAAAPLTGTRFGDCKGNSGITFPAAKTVYWANAAGSNWGVAGAGNWSATLGGAAAANQFPLAQDTAIFPAAPYPNGPANIGINALYNIGTIDTSLRTAALADNLTIVPVASSTTPIYGSLITGPGAQINNIGVTLLFCGRITQNITSSGVLSPFIISINSPGGTVKLLDDLNIFYGSVTNTLVLTAGTFDANNFNVTLDGILNSSNSNTRTLAMGSGTWTFSGSGTVWNTATSTNLTGTGTATIALTSGSAKTFSGGGINLSGVTLWHVGIGALTISGNNTFYDIKAAPSLLVNQQINFGGTTQTLTTFTASSASPYTLTLTGTSNTVIANLVLTGSMGTPDYINVRYVRAYPVFNTWKIGANSTNSGSLGFLFQAGGGIIYNSSVSEASTVADQVAGAVVFFASVTEILNAIDAESTTAIFTTSVAETSQSTDVPNAAATFPAVASETVAAADQNSTAFTAVTNIAESAAAADTATALAAFVALTEDNASASDQTLVAPSTFNAIAAATAQAFDNVNAPGSIYNTALIESAVALDSIIGAYLWNLIDDAQSSNWSGEVTAQEPVWGNVLTTQSSSWNLVPSDSVVNITPAWMSSATNGEITIAMLRQPYRNGGYAYSSQDGPWTYRQIASLSPFVFIDQTAFVNGKFYAWSAETANVIYRSVDGLNWTQFQPPNPSLRVRSVFGNGSQLIIQQSSAAIYASTDDGMTWSTGSTPSTPAPSTGAVWDGSKYVYNTGRGILTSTDGLTWTVRAAFSIAGGAAKGSIAFINGTYYAVQQKTASNVQPERRKSTDGITWTSNIQGLPAYSLMVFPFGNKFAFAAAGPYTYGNLTYVTLDSITGEIQYLGQVSGAALDSFFFASFAPSFYKGKFVLPMLYGAAGENEITTSSDLITFVKNRITELGTGDDNQSPGWQNISA